MSAWYARQITVNRDASESPWVKELIQVQAGVIKHRRFFQKYTWVLDGLYQYSPTDRNLAVIEKGKTWRKMEAWREIESMLTTSCSPLR